MKALRTLTNGIIRENPILVLVLGTCPFLALPTQPSNAIMFAVLIVVLLVKPAALPGRYVPETV